MLISPTEPDHLKALGTVSGKPERYGADILVIGKGQKIAVQRKAFPEDLYASMHDGRLHEQLPKLSQLTSFLVLVGRGHWTTSGNLMHSDIRLTWDAVEGLLFSATFQFGVHVRWMASEELFVRWLKRLEDWVKEPSHTALMSRPKPKSKGWGQIPKADWERHLLQSFPGVGPKVADAIRDHFGGVPLSWGVTREEMMAVPGVGKKLTEGMYKVMMEKKES